MAHFACLRNDHCQRIGQASRCLLGLLIPLAVRNFTRVGFVSTASRVNTPNPPAFESPRGWPLECIQPCRHDFNSVCQRKWHRLIAEMMSQRRGCSCVYGFCDCSGQARCCYRRFYFSSRKAGMRFRHFPDRIKPRAAPVTSTFRSSTTSGKRLPYQIAAAATGAGQKDGNHFEETARPEIRIRTDQGPAPRVGRAGKDR